MKMQRRSRRSAITLPDDITIKILSRIPALDVLKCRRVCRRWRDLISTKHFREMHFKAKAYHSLMILADCYGPLEEKSSLLLLDKWEKPRKTPTFWKAHLNRLNLIDNSGSDVHDVKLSHDGLIVTESIGVNNSLGFNIFNPISRYAVRIDTLDYKLKVYGMFFNPLIKEYCILLHKSGSMEFQMLNLGAQPCCRTVIDKPKSLNISSEYQVVTDDNATVYWLQSHHSSLSCEELIMAFDIKMEKFAFMPHPHPIDNCHRLEHKGMHIVKIDECLSFVQSTITSGRALLIINIWTLKDSATRLWIKTYNISIDINLGINKWMRDSDFRVMAVGNGEMLLCYSNCKNDGVCVYNLDLGTLRRIGKSYLDRYSDFVPNFFYVFVPSFVSLRNCKPIVRL